MTRLSNGFYTFSDRHFKAMRKQDLINYIRMIEKNWENQLINNDIQYSNCKRLLAEERNKAIDEFAELLKDKVLNHFTYRGIIEEPTEYADYIDEIAEEMKGGTT